MIINDCVKAQTESKTSCSEYLTCLIGLITNQWMIIWTMRLIQKKKRTKSNIGYQQKKHYFTWIITKKEQKRSQQKEDTRNFFFFSKNHQPNYQNATSLLNISVGGTAYTQSRINMCSNFDGIEYKQDLLLKCSATKSYYNYYVVVDSYTALQLLGLFPVAPIRTHF